jgi:hypothetical protein
LAGRALLKIAYLLMRWLFGLAVAVRGDQVTDAELLVLRHENAALRAVKINQPAGTLASRRSDSA